MLVSPRSAWSITHKVPEDIVVLALELGRTHAGLRLELVVFPGGGFCPSRSYWRLVSKRRETCAVLGGLRAARA